MPNTDFKSLHNLNFDNNFINKLVADHINLGISKEDMSRRTPKQGENLVIGEYLWKLHQMLGKMVSGHLQNSQLSNELEWFDHRHHLLDTDREFNDFWTMSGNNAIRVMPFGAKILNLCAGDCFYDYYFFKDRADEIVCVDNDPDVMSFAKRLHSANNISFVLDSVLNYKPKNNYYDIVIIRGAIEHFSQADQQFIFRTAHSALKSGGWFCGDTPAAYKHTSEKMLKHHENEWNDEGEMKDELSMVFTNTKTYTLQSRYRNTLFWRCQKIEELK